MKSLLAGLSAAALLTSVAAVAFAGPTPSPAAKKPAAKPAVAATTKKCPSCGMPMGLTKTAAAPVAVPIGGKTFYCCATCASGKAMAAKAAKSTKMATPAPKK